MNSGILLLINVALLVIIIYLLQKQKVQLSNRLAIIQQVLSGKTRMRILRDEKEKDAVLDFAINDLIDALHQTKIEGDQSELKRRELLSNISHDIRTPITSIIGYIDALVDDKITDPEERAQYLLIAAEKSRELKRLTDEVFELAKIDADEIEMRPERLEINELLRSTVIGFLPQLQAVKMEVVNEIPDEKNFVYADRTAITRIFQNLIQNAIQHGQSGKILGLRVEKHRNQYIVSIWNLGEPIPEEKIGRVFERLFKADDSRKTKSGNHGLGLSIAKRLTEKNGGTIRVDSSLNRETTFSVRFSAFLG
jgi:signal transduction histidine kinase